MSTLSHLTDRVAGSLRPGTRRDDSVGQVIGTTLINNAPHWAVWLPGPKS
jgi:hypothetical protein